MLKKNLIIGGTLIVGIALFSLVNMPFEVDTAVANNEPQKPLFTKEEELNISILNTVTEKIHEKYECLEFVVSSNSQMELRIEVKENEEYFNSVKKDIESIVKSLIKSSALKDYTVVVDRLDLYFITEEDRKLNKELLQITSTIMEGLKGYAIIGDINTEYQKSITIHTAIKGSDRDAHKLAMEIEQAVNDILHSQELDSLSNMDSYEIKILNTKGKVVN